MAKRNDPYEMALKAQDTSVQYAANLYGVKPSTVLRHCRRFNITVKEESSDLQQFDSWTDYADVLERLQEINEKKYKYTTEKVEINLDPRGDIMLWLSDIHLGSGGFDFAEFKNLTQTIIDNNIKFALVGDNVDYFFTSFKHAGAVFGQIIPPEIQEQFFLEWLDDVGNHLQLIIKGNHDAFVEKVIGHNLFLRLQSKFAPVIDGIGRVIVNAGRQSYLGSLAHRGRGNSNINKAHGGFRHQREVDSNADFVVTGHHHDPVLGQQFQGGKNVVTLRGGTLKVVDEYSRNFTFGNSHAIFPACFFYPDEKRIVPFMNVYDALKFRAGVWGDSPKSVK